MIAFGPTTYPVPSTTRPSMRAPLRPRAGTTSRFAVTRPLNIATSRSSTRAAVAFDEPIRRTEPSAGYAYSPVPALPTSVPSAERTSARPSVAACADAGRSRRRAATPAPRRSMEAASLLGSGPRAPRPALHLGLAGGRVPVLERADEGVCRGAAYERRPVDDDSPSGDGVALHLNEEPSNTTTTMSVLASTS